MSDFYEWDRKTTLDLIEIYKSYEALWNSNHSDYKNKSLRQNALREIADRLHIDKSEIERKFKNVSSNYLRELKKEKESKLRGGPVYKSKWYAFKPLKFLNDRPIHHRSRGTILDPSVCAQILMTKGEESRASQISDESSTDNDEPTTNNDESTKRNATPPYEYIPKQSKSVLIKIEDPLTRPFEELSESVSYREESPTYGSTTSKDEFSNIRHTKKDEPSTFGEYIGKKIRPMDRRTKAIVEFEINSIIFKAEMGFYNDKKYDQV